MKLFLIGFGGTRPEQIEVARRLKEHHDIQYWVRMEHVLPLDTKEFPGTIFHSYRDALAGRPASGIDASHFDPPSTELTEMLAPYESEFLTMSNKWYPDWPVSKRKDFYYDLLCYWDGVLDIYRPDTIIFLEIPHEMYSFILFALAKHRQIRTLMFENVLRSDRLLIYEDYRIGNVKVATQAKLGFPFVPVEQLSQGVREYWEEQTAERDKTPRYMLTQKKELTGISNAKRLWRARFAFLKDGSFFERAVMRLFKLFKENARSEYERFQQSPDYTKPYVYVALHYQPERTTAPQAGVYVDQVLMVKTLAAGLPEGWELYVKEHPSQWLTHGPGYTQYRYQGFAQSLAAIPNVRLVSVSTDTFELTKHARAVATATGTAGWEGLCRSKPVIVFGYPWFMHAPGIFRIASVADARAALRLIADGYVPDRQDVLNYLGFLDVVAIKAFIEDYGRTIASDVNVESATEAMRQALEQTLTM